MFVFSIIMDRAGILAEVDSERAYTRIAKQVHQELGQFWFDNFAAEHFQPGADTKYNYAPRAAAYLRRKGNRPPLVFRGNLARRILQNAVVRGFPSRFTVTMKATDTINGPVAKDGTKHALQRHKRKYPDIPSEITTIAQSEEDLMTRFAEHRLAELVMAHKTKKRTRRKL